ncbi:hypothetical protein AQUCO_01000573v1 [Aquilegia coerulea]|uniref:histidinol-phosphatase n=2 Tax=Aquilegia coerulea TaxID=218851 RepID=A0A2G5EB49_AQUCA|nr:hypothetical protein AQUCO_01000573v1 [Aquilegia coerulea]
MLSQSHFLSQNPIFSPISSITLVNNTNLLFPSCNFLSCSSSSSSLKFSICRRSKSKMSVNSNVPNGLDGITLGFDYELDKFVKIGNKVADVAGEVILKYFRKSFVIVDKDDLSPVTIADREAEEAMVSIILENFPSHAIFGEENGWKCKEKTADYVWVLDPIDGTKSFITGKPLFGTLIALLYKGKPIVGIIDQPVLRERWIGMSGRQTTLNGQEISTRSCSKLSQAYLYTTSPHLFSGDAEKAFDRVRNKVKVPLYGCDCYAYALLASGFVDLVVESGLKPYDFLSLVPVIEGAGGVITDWNGNQLHWEASSDSCPTSFNVVAAGDKQLHQQTLDSLQWH